MTSDLRVNVDGSARAAVLLMTLGDRLAGEILKYLDPQEVQKIGLAMANIKTVSRQDVTATLDDFLAQLPNRTSFGIGNEDYLRKTFSEALGKDKADSLINRIMAGEKTSGMEALKWMDPPAIALLIRNEHPQIVAIVLAHLSAEKAAEVLLLFPHAQRSDLITRIATLDSVAPTALSELDAILDQKFADNKNVQSSRIGGLTTAVDVLNLLEKSIGTEILDSIKEQDAVLGTVLDESLFTFDDLIDVSDRGIQQLLRELTKDVLVTALKGADDRIKEKIFRNMSKRAAAFLQDDLEGTAPIRLSEVERAQKEIVVVARKMAEAGELSLGKGDDYV